MVFYLRDSDEESACGRPQARRAKKQLLSTPRQVIPKRSLVFGTAVMLRLQILLRRFIHPLVQRTIRRTIRRWFSPAGAAPADITITTADIRPLQPWLAPVAHAQPQSGHQHRPWWWTLPIWLYQCDDWSLLLPNLAHKPLLLLPVFNHAAALEQAMQALLMHDTGFDQLILLDDGSTDPAVLLLMQQYKQLPGIRLIRHAKRAGLAGCWQKGLQLAASRNQDLVLLSTDIFVSPGWLLQLKLAAYSKPQIASVSANQQVRLGLPHWWSVRLRQQQQQNCVRALAQAGYATLVKDEVPASSCLYIRASALALVVAEQTEPAALELTDFLQSSSQLGLQHLQSNKAVVWPFAGHHSHYRMPAPFSQSAVPWLRAIGKASNAKPNTSSNEHLAATQQQHILQQLALTSFAKSGVKPRKLLLLAGELQHSLLTSISERPAVTELISGAVEWLLCQYNGTELRLAYCYPDPASIQFTLTLDQIALPKDGLADATLLEHTMIRWLMQWSVEVIDVSLVSTNPCPALQLLVAQCRQICRLLELEQCVDGE